jgi:hypothetical protein
MRSSNLLPAARVARTRKHYGSKRELVAAHAGENDRGRCAGQSQLSH